MTIYKYNEQTKSILIGDCKKLYINKVNFDFNSFPLYEKALCKNYKGSLNPPDLGYGFLTFIDDPDWVTFLVYKPDWDLEIAGSREAYGIKFEHNDRTGFLITIEKSGIIFFDWQDFKKSRDDDQRFGSLVIFYEDDEIKEIVEYRKTSNEIFDKYYKGAIRVYNIDFPIGI